MKILLIAIVFIAVALFATRLLKQFLFPPLEKYTEAEWTLQDCGSLGLQVSSPLELKSDNEVDEQINDKGHKVIEAIESYTASIYAGRLSVSASSVLYKSGIEGSLRGAVQGSLNDLQKQQGISSFRFDVTTIRHAGIPGSLIRGKWKERNRFYGFQQAIYVRKNMAWVVMVIYDLEDPSGKEIAERIIRSIQITPDMSTAVVMPPAASGLPALESPPLPFSG